MKVIVCDDNKEYVDQITGFFDRYTREHQKNFIVYPFYDAETMFEFFKKSTDIEIIVLDIVFVHSNGIEVAKRIRGINTKTRIFFVSAYEKFAVEGYGLSADEYLLKPFRYMEFEKALSRVLLKIQSKLVKANEKIAKKVTGGYKKIEEGVVGGYKKIEEGAVGGFTKISDSFVDEFLTKDGESVEEAKMRLAAEQQKRDEARIERKVRK